MAPRRLTRRTDERESSHSLRHRHVHWIRSARISAPLARQPPAGPWKDGKAPEFLGAFGTAPPREAGIAYISISRCNLQCPILRRSLARSIDRYHIAGRGDRIGESGRPHPAVRVAACRPRRRAAPNCEQLRRSGPTEPCARRELTMHGHMSLVPLLRSPPTPRRGVIGTARSTAS